MNNESLPKLLLIDKPKGISSFTVIRELRRRTGVRKFGHAGTLDPLASGLMLIGVESGTKLLTDLVGLDKEYVAEVLLGEKRTTGDMEGEIIAERAYEGEYKKADLEAVLMSMIGDITLPVSAYSAIKKAGVPMYKRARQAEAKGEVVTDVPSRTMHVWEVELLQMEEIAEPFPRLLLTIRFKVSSGTYVRSLAEEFGQRVNYPATLRNLRRTKIGSYSIDDAVQLEEFRNRSLE